MALSTSNFFGAQQYRNPDWGGLVTRMKGHTPTGGATFPRILKGAKFMDQLRAFKVENTSGEFETVSSRMCLSACACVRDRAHVHLRRYACETRTEFF